MKKGFYQSILASKSLLMVMVVLCLGFSLLSPINAYSKIQEGIKSHTISVDGVEVILTSPIITQSEFYFPQPYDIVQNSYSVDFKPVYKEISLLAIPYGITPRTENLPVSSPNSESIYREALQSFRNAQGGNPKGGITANIFGSQVLGTYSIVQLNVSGATPVPVIIGEWVIELSSRIWILRISSELPSSYKQTDVDLALQSLQNTILSSRNTDTPSTSRFPTSKISGQIENESIVSPDSPLYSDLPTPSWWNGDCDTNYFYSQTGVMSYRLGAVYRNMPACGPKNYEVLRNFGVGVTQLEFQCPELSKRFLYLAYGIAPYSANGSQVVWNYSGTLLQKITNGTPGKAPQLNDVLSYGSTTTAGHTSVVASSSVDSSGNGWITVIEENLSDNGWQALQVSNWTVIGNVAAVSGWLHDPSQDSVCPGPTLNSPSNDFISSSQTISFSWTGPSGCTYSGYTFRVKDTSNMETGGTTIFDEGQGGTSVTKTFGTEWNYKDLYWGVRTANPLSPNWSVRHFRIEPSSSSCSPSSNQVSLFVNANYGGVCITKNIGEYSNPSSIGIPNDSVSSLKVGSDVQAILCKDDDYLGGCETFTSDDADLSNNSIGDDSVSSLKVIYDGSAEHPIQLYKDANFVNGYCYIDTASWFNLDGACESYNEQISSFKLQTGWSVRFFKEFGLTGSNQCFTSADLNLSDNTYTDGTGMNDTISSVALYNQSSCPPLIVPPSAPTLSSPANNAVLDRIVNLTLSWNPVSSASEYYTEFFGGPSISLNSGWTTNTSWDLGNQWGGVYQWRVKARNSAGESGWSETRTLTIKYGSPTNLTAASVSTSQINLSWGASVDAPGNIDGYRIYRDDSPIATTNSSTTTYNDTGLNPGTTYSYFVKAYRGTIESDSSNITYITTPLGTQQVYLPMVIRTIIVPIMITARVPGNEYDGFEDTVIFNISGDINKNNWIGTSRAVMTGLIFSDVKIPEGARIQEAHLTVRGYGMDGYATARILGFAQDNPPVFLADGSNRPSTRPSTQAYTDWYRYWPFSWEYFQSPDISSVIQEIIDRPGWSEGNRIGLKITNPFGTGINWSIVDFIAGDGHDVSLSITFIK